MHFRDVKLPLALQETVIVRRSKTFRKKKLSCSKGSNQFPTDSYQFGSRKPGQESSFEKSDYSSHFYKMWILSILLVHLEDRVLGQSVNFYR